MTFDSCAQRTARSMSDWPAMARVFLPGSPFEPARAGIRPRRRTRNSTEPRRVLYVADLVEQTFDVRARRQECCRGRDRPTEVRDVQMIRGVRHAHDLESAFRQIGARGE